MATERSTRAVAQLLIAGLSAIGSGALDVGGEISGTVRDSTGAVLVGALVTLQGSDGQVTSTSTDAQGRYRMSGFPRGVYTLLVHKDGFSPPPKR